jgi:UDP-N-acetyl-D-mannosaminuronic acid dehydrogenase
MTIGIIGLGYVGLTLAMVAANRGFTVYGTEISPLIKECLSQDRAHFFETGLDELIHKYNRKSFFCVDTFPDGVSFDAFIITVGTPLLEGQKLPNFNYIKRASQSLAGIYNGEQLIILRSTVSIGTTRKVLLPCLSKLCGKPEGDLLVAMCPERTIEGKALSELVELPQIISGNNDHSLEIANGVFSRITNRIIKMNSLEEAEIAKLYCNVYRDMMFTIGNVLNMAAQEFNLDGIGIIRAANDGYPRSNIAAPGFVAGPCLEKDAYILAHGMPECPEKSFILSGRKLNEQLEDTVVNWAERNSKSKVVAISGMSFKGVPETSDLRGSSSVNIAKKLNAKGYTLRLHDFKAQPEEVIALGLGNVYQTIYEACETAELLLVLNNNAKYADVEAKGRLRQQDFIIFDAWGVCSKLASSEVALVTLGNINIVRGNNK